MTSTNREAVRILGSIRSDGSTGSIRVEDRYPTDIDDLWAAITEPARLARWLIVDLVGIPAVGETLSATFTSGWEGPVRIDVCDAPRRLLVTGNPGTPDETQTEAWLTAEGDSTRLVIEERGFTLGEVTDHAAGWQVHIEDLAAALDGRDRTDWSARWKELRPAYEPLRPATS
jgi:uncharacterized protein YndB with AHSA1/START domain